MMDDDTKTTYLNGDVKHPVTEGKGLNKGVREIGGGANLKTAVPKGRPKLSDFQNMPEYKGDDAGAMTAFRDAISKWDDEQATKGAAAQKKALEGKVK